MKNEKYHTRSSPEDEKKTIIWMYNFQEEFFDEVHVPSEESMRSCICVLDVSYRCCLFLRFLLDFRSVSLNSLFCSLYFMEAITTRVTLSRNFEYAISVYLLFLDGDSLKDRCHWQIYCGNSKKTFVYDNEGILCNLVHTTPVL
jgi:hypothetical protein